MRCSFITALALTAAAALLGAPAVASPVLSELSEAMAQVVESVRPAVVMVQSELHSPRPTTEILDESRGGSRLLNLLERHDPYTEFLMSQPGLIAVNEGLGSGVIIDPRGLVLTNAHLVDEFNVFFVTLLDRSEYPARLVGFDAYSDIALLEIVNTEGRTLPAASLGSSADLRVGEMVLAIGTPLEPELAQSVSAGIVSALARSVDVAEFENFIQTDCAINPGNSGGPLVNLRGEVVGINTAIATLTGANSGIGFAVPIDDARHIADQLLRRGRVARGYLGVSITDVTRDAAMALGIPGLSGGALVSEVKPGTPAQAADLRPYDVIVGCDGVPIDSANALKMRISSSDVGSTVLLQLIRAGQRQEIPVQLAELDFDTFGFRKGSTAVIPAPPPVDPNSFGLIVEELTPEVRDRLHLDPETKLHGPVVTYTAPGSYAAHLNVWPGTRVVEVNQTRVDSATEFNEILSSFQGDLLLLHVETAWGDPMIVTLRRGQ